MSVKWHFFRNHIDLSTLHEFFTALYIVQVFAIYRSSICSIFSIQPSLQRVSYSSVVGSTPIGTLGVLFFFLFFSEYAGVIHSMKSSVIYIPYGAIYPSSLKLFYRYTVSVTLFGFVTKDDGLLQTVLAFYRMFLITNDSIQSMQH